MTVYIVTYEEYYGNGRRKEFSNDVFRSKEEALAYFDDQISNIDKDDELSVEENGSLGILKEAIVSSPLMFTGEMKIRYRQILTEAWVG